MSCLEWNQSTTCVIRRVECINSSNHQYCAPHCKQIYLFLACLFVHDISILFLSLFHRSFSLARSVPSFVECFRWFFRCELHVFGSLNIWVFYTFDDFHNTENGMFDILKWDLWILTSILQVFLECLHNFTCISAFFIYRWSSHLWCSLRRSDKFANKLAGLFSVTKFLIYVNIIRKCQQIGRQLNATFQALLGFFR